MKKVINQALSELKQAHSIEKSKFDLLQVLTPQELATLEGVSVRDSFETWGAYRIMVLYSDFPDYLFFELDEYSMEDIKMQLTEWMQWCNIIK